MTAMPVGAIRNATVDAMSRMDEPRADAVWPADAFSAELIARDGREARIAWRGVCGSARIAFGCSIQPEPGDRVLTTLADDTPWIIAVLERSSDAPPRLWAEGDLEIVSARGDVSVTAGRMVDIGAGESVRATAPEIDLQAGVARFVLDELVQVGRKVIWFVDKVRSVGEVVETFADHVLMRAKRSSRFVEESDQMRARDIDHRAECTLQLDAEVAFITAETVVRMDADQIHMG